MKVKVMAKGTGMKWKKYIPEGCGEKYFFVNKKLAEEWENASKERKAAIEKFDERIEAITSLNEMQIERLIKSRKQKHALKIAKDHAKKNPGCNCPWCRMAGS